MREGVREGVCIKRQSDREMWEDKEIKFDTKSEMESIMNDSKHTLIPCLRVKMLQLGPGHWLRSL